MSGGGPPGVPRNISLHEGWFIEDYEPQINTVMPEWRRFGETAKLALHEIYQMSQAVRAKRVLADRFDHARDTSDTYYYEFFLPLGPLGPTPRLDWHREDWKRTLERHRKEREHYDRTGKLLEYGWWANPPAAAQISPA